MKIISSNRWGFGIHSPYIYSLISRVIYGKRSMAPHLRPSGMKLNRKEKMFLALADRLIRFYKPGLIVLAGRNDEFHRWIAHTHPDVQVVYLREPGRYIPEENHQFVIWAGLPETMPDIPCHLNNVCWIFRKDNRYCMDFLMNNLRISEKVSVTLDLHHAGIAIFNRDLQKENYEIRRFF
jgi:hypothetical protein